MADSTKQLVVELNTDSRKFVRGMKEATDATETFEEAAEQASKVEIDPKVNTGYSDKAQAANAKLVADLKGLSDTYKAVKLEPTIDQGAIDKASASMDKLGNEVKEVGGISRTEVGPMRDVTGTLGGSATAALDYAEVLTGLGETLEALGPQFSGMAGAIGKVGFVGALAGAGIAAIAQASDALSKVTERVEQGLKDMAFAAVDSSRAFQGYVAANDALEDKFLDLENASRGLLEAFSLGGKSTDKLTKANEAWNKVMEKSPGVAAQLLPILKERNAEIGLSAEQLQQYENDLEDAAKTEALAAQSAKAYSENVDTVSKALEMGIDITRMGIGRMKEEVAQREALNSEIEREVSALEDTNSLRETALDLAEEQMAQHRNLADITRDVAEAEVEAADAFKEANKQGGKAADTNKRATDAAISLADGVVDQARAMYEANGQTLTTAKSQEIWNGKMLASAATAKGPLQQSILGYIGQVNAIPPEKVTEIQAAVDAGDLALANRLIDNAARDRDSTIRTQADLSAFQQAWNTAIMNWKAQVGDLRSSLVGIAMMAGTPYYQGGTTLVGEAGPELVHLPKGSSITNAHQTALMTARGQQQPGQTVVNYNLTVQVAAGAQPAVVGAELVNFIKAYERANGSAWRRVSGHG